MAKERADLQAKLIKEENAIIDLAMYRIWSVNPDIDVSSMGSKQMEILTKWKARLAEEEFATSFTSETTTMVEDKTKASSKATTKDVPVEVTIDAIPAEAATGTTPTEATTKATPAALAEVAFEAGVETSQPSQL